MLAADEIIDARVLRQRRVRFAVDTGVNQRRRAPPIFIGRKCVEDFRRGLLFDRQRQNAVFLARLRVGLLQIGERKDVGRIEERREGAGVAGRLGEAMIEATVAASRDVRVDGVENLPVFFVGVEALIDEVAKVAAGLRDAESQRRLTEATSLRSYLKYDARSRVA